MGPAKGVGPWDKSHRLVTLCVLISWKLVKLYFKMSI